MPLLTVNLDDPAFVKRLGRKFTPRVAPDEVLFDSDVGFFDTAEELEEITAAARAKKINNATNWPRVIVFRIVPSTLLADVKARRRFLFIEGGTSFRLLRLF